MTNLGGVSFQPGLQDDQMRRRNGTPGGSDGVQEAIKVLSLRLPRVVGAQALAPSLLLNAPGGMGHPGIDSIVEKVLRKFFPGGSGAGAQAPMVSPPVLGPGPNESGKMPPSAPDLRAQMDWLPERQSPAVDYDRRPRFTPGDVSPEAPSEPTPPPIQPSEPVPYRGPQSPYDFTSFPL